MSKRRRRAGKVRVTYADGRVETKRPGAFRKPRRPKKRSRYANYLRSSHWQDRRRAVLLRDRYRCTSCGSRTRLQVHHRTYARIGREHSSDLVTLCDRCHRSLHRRRDA